MLQALPFGVSSESMLRVASMDGGKERELGAVSLIVFWRDQSCLQNNALIVNPLESQRSFRLDQRLLKELLIKSKVQYF